MLFLKYFSIFKLIFQKKERENFTEISENFFFYYEFTDEQFR